MALRKVEHLTLRTAARTRDEAFPGSWLYPSDQRIEGLPLCQVPATHYVIHTRYAGEGVPAVPFLMQILSTAPDGVRYGWDTCGGCGSYITRCECMLGLAVPQYMRPWLQLNEETRREPTLTSVHTVLQERPRHRVEPAEPIAEETTPMDIDAIAEAAASSSVAKLRKRLRLRL